MRGLIAPRSGDDARLAKTRWREAPDEVENYKTIKENTMQALKQQQEPSVDLEKVDIEAVRKRYEKYSEMIYKMNSVIERLKAKGGNKA